MKILLDMNLSPEWVPFLTSAGFDVVHWSTVGNPRASDSELMAWARENAKGPSVLQVRVKNTMPSAIGADVVRVLHLRREAIECGALVTIDKANARVRVLPIGSRGDDEPA